MDIHRFAVAAFALLSSHLAMAATLAATPDSIGSVIARASAGDVIRLAPGDYGNIDLKGKSWQPAITIEAGTATIANVRLNAITGFHWRGGQFDGGDTRTTGFSAGGSQDIRLERAVFNRFTRNGVVIGGSSDVDLIGNRFAGMGSDGIQVAESRRITIDGNNCADFHHTEKAHPDCIQLWSRPATPATADIIIRNNVMNGTMQGISLFNHVRNGVDDGGFDRITIIGNDVAISDYYHGIAVYSCRNCLIRDNKVTTLRGENPKAHAWIKVVDGSDVKLCANVVSAFRDPGGERPCKGDVPQSVSQMQAR